MLRLSDILRQDQIVEDVKGKGKGKGKGKAISSDLSTSLYDAIKKSQSHLEQNIEKFKEILQQRGSETEVDIQHEQEEYGIDLQYNSIPTLCYYEYLTEGESVALDGGETGVSSHFSEIYDKAWLLLQCEIHVSEYGDRELSLTPEGICTNIFTILRSDKEDADIEASLVDLLGFDNLEFVQKLIMNRKTIITNIYAQNDTRQSNNRPTLLNSEDKKFQHVPRIAQSVIVYSEAEKRESKSIRKEQKKARAKNDEDTESALILGFNGEEFRRQRDEPLRGAKDVYTSEEIQYPHVYGASQQRNILSVLGQKFALPNGTKRDEREYYEEITIPMTKTAATRSDENVIYIKDLDDLCRGCFPESYKRLNRVQSQVYETAYHTNENMLICAPTGAGKTDIALLTILRTISNYSQPIHSIISERPKFSIAKNDFKIVYVAPMKALAAEVVRKFQSRLDWLGIQVKELTGDMQLTRHEITSTQILVTTPEKWDVVTRKSTGDVELVQKVKLLIIDEVHLLHDDRGSVLESVVARTLRQVESTQKLIRIIGLSATLPNYVDVAHFLRVNPYVGMFYFGGGYRPVPLEQHFIGVKEKPGTAASSRNLNRACWDKVIELIREGRQVMVFVHSRKDTVKTANSIREFAIAEGVSEILEPVRNNYFNFAEREVSKSKNKELKELFGFGIGIHHAGMLRSDRRLAEKLFENEILCCTSTLAWGVNLPAYAVVIKGTQIYDSTKGTFVDLSVLDVMQIFGRAGRPQFKNPGYGYLLTTHDKLSVYVSAMTQQHPIESKFAQNVIDNLNAEISLGTVTTVDEAVQWLGYTYLFVRMRKNPYVYGMKLDEPERDPLLGKRRRDLVIDAAKTLQKNQMITFIESTGSLSAKDLGRVASNFYVGYRSIETFNARMKPRMTESEVLAMISHSSEFDQIKSREEESTELENLQKMFCPYEIRETTDATPGKVNILLQSYVSQTKLDDFSLISDLAYVSQNAARLVRALFEISLNRRWSETTIILLQIAKCIEKRMWEDHHPLRQFNLPEEILKKLEAHNHQHTIEELRDMDPSELGQLVRHVRMGRTISRALDQFPSVNVEADIVPITNSVLRVTVTVTPTFEWNDRIHGMIEPWWIWVTDPDSTDIHHSEYFLIGKRTIGESRRIDFTIPIHDPLPAQIYIHAVSDRWLGAETMVPVSFQHLILPERYPEFTELLDLQPLPITALRDEVLEKICAERFLHFNPIQTQIFHTLYYNDVNVLIGAPTGSGKTVAAELAMWWAFREKPGSKVVYIAPLKALVRERVDDWRKRLTTPMNKRLVELTGDETPDMRTMKNADIIITTPEKWDGISRSWQNRSYVQAVSCVIIDEIHLLGGDRGPVLEVIVSRMNYIGIHQDRKVRIVGLSTALANAYDLSEWLGINEIGLFNFRHSVRPVPLEIHIEGFAGKHYCPRMASMNKPAFMAIKAHSPTQSVIVFVSSRRQTRLTAQDLITYCGMEDNPIRFRYMDDDELAMVAAKVKDNSLRMSLQFGIGLHHAGLVETDRKIVEELFVTQKIQILVATSTLAWGVNFPAHLVVIKGTEYYDAKTRGYVDFPITDILQMMGRAGRPQYDTTGIACIFVQDGKKDFYKNFLHEPFPVESSLHLNLHDHFNAEIASGTISSKQDAMDYLTWTYFYRRLFRNPSYYGLDEVKPAAISTFLSKLIENTINDLANAGCVEVIDDLDLATTSYGLFASYYYLSYKTVGRFRNKLKKGLSIKELLILLCDAEEYSELPVRHNEDVLNREMQKDVRWTVSADTPYDSPSAKAFLLLQGHMNRMKLPITDYITDTVSVLDQAVRISQAMIDMTAENGLLATTLNIMNMVQCLKQARWPDDSSLLTIPTVDRESLDDIRDKNRYFACLAELANLPDNKIQEIFGTIHNADPDKILKYLRNLPLLNISISLPQSFTTSTLASLSVTLVHPSHKHSSSPPRVHAPNFPKPQFESWWIVLGDGKTDELIAMRRAVLRGKETRVKMDFYTPDREGEYHYSVFVICDGYLGIDQQEEITVVVTKA